MEQKQKGVRNVSGDYWHDKTYLEGMEDAFRAWQQALQGPDVRSGNYYMTPADYAKVESLLALRRKQLKEGA